MPSCRDPVSFFWCLVVASLAAGDPRINPVGFIARWIAGAGNCWVQHCNQNIPPPPAPPTPPPAP